MSTVTNKLPRTPLTILQGSTFNPRVNIYGQNGALVVWNNYQARMQARLSPSAATPLFELTTANGGITISGGNIDLFMDATQTAQLSFDEAYYDLEVHDSAGVQRVLQGKITLDREITR